MKPQPKTYPITEIFSGGESYEIRGVTEHYFPSKYDDIECVVKSFHVDIKNFRQMELSVVYELKGDKKVIDGLYEEEGWKFARTEYLLKNYPEEASRFITPAPTFCLMLNKYLQVISSKLMIDGQDSPIVCDQSADLLLLPTSHPPLTDLGENDFYSYYDKKSTVFYTDIRMGVEYRLSAVLEANAATFELAPLFPFGKVTYEKMSCTSSGEYEIQPIAMLVKPVTSKEFPEWFQYQLDKLISYEPRMPRLRAALPYRGTFPLFDMTEALMSESVKTKEDIEKLIESLVIDLDKPLTLENYNALRFGFAVLIPHDKNTDILVRSIQRPLPTRIYEQMQALPNYRDVLVEYDIFNLSDKKLRLRVETEIFDYTDKVVKTIFIHGMKNKQGQKARQILNQCPRLKKGILDGLIKSEHATLSCKVTDEDNHQVMYEETFNIDLLPNDEIIWELRDVRSSHIYHLQDFICAWVNPTDRNGMLDKIRTGASRKHPDGAFGHKTATLADIEAHVRALYDYLNEYGLNYVNQPFSSKTSSTSQRVVLPEDVLKNKSGNCIDLTVLFASLLEGLGIYSLILMMPGHAFIGWGNKRNPSEMLFLETTMIGKKGFDEAKEAGRKEFMENFLFKGSSLPLSADITAKMLGCHIIDLKKVRHSGTVSIKR